MEYQVPKMSTIQRHDSGRPHPVIDATPLAPNDGQKFKSVEKKLILKLQQFDLKVQQKKNLTKKRLFI